MPGIELRGGDQQVELPDTGAIDLQGVATVWEDLRAPSHTLRAGGAGVPAWAQIKDNGAASIGVYGYFFDDTAPEYLFFQFQIPHAYKEGTDIYFHVHWVPTNANVGFVRWGLEYTWVNQDAVMGNTTIVSMDQAVNNENDKHIRTDFAAIAGAGKTISSMLVCRVFRDAAADTYVGDAALLEVDIHYEIDTMGSRQIVTK